MLLGIALLGLPFLLGLGIGEFDEEVVFIQNEAEVVFLSLNN